MSGEQVRGDRDALEFSYRNHRGEVGRRRVYPVSVRYGASEWHREPQWLMRAWDLDKDAEREFAMKDMGATSVSDLGETVRRQIVDRCLESYNLAALIGHDAQFSPIGQLCRQLLALEKDCAS